MLDLVVGDDFDPEIGDPYMGAPEPLRTLARVGRRAARAAQPVAAEGLTPLPFEPALVPGGGGQVEMKAWQQIMLAGPYRLQLAVGGWPDDFSVNGIRIGQNELCAGLGSVPARAFVLAEGRMVQDLQLLHAPVLQPGSLAQIRIENLGVNSAHVRATLWGRTLRDTTCSLPPLAPPAPRAVAALQLMPDPFPLLSDLRFGCRGPAVRIWQVALRLLGFDIGSFGPGRDGIDECFGPLVSQATRRVQQDDFERFGEPEVVSELGCVNHWTRRALARRIHLGAGAFDFSARHFRPLPVRSFEPPAPPVVAAPAPAQLPPAPATPPEPAPAPEQQYQCRRCHGWRAALEEGFCAGCASLPQVAAWMGDRQATAALLAARAADPEPDHSWQTAAWEE